MAYTLIEPVPYATLNRFSIETNVLQNQGCGYICSGLLFSGITRRLVTKIWSVVAVYFSR